MVGEGGGGLKPGGHCNVAAEWAASEDKLDDRSADIEWPVCDSNYAGGGLIADGSRADICRTVKDIAKWTVGKTPHTGHCRTAVRQERYPGVCMIAAQPRTHRSERAARRYHHP